MTSPHTRLLGSLHEMLYLHYTSGIEAEMLRFEEVCEDDPLILGPEYVHVPEDKLPELGGELWWKVLPASVSLKEPTPSPSIGVPLSMVVQGPSSQPDQAAASHPKLVLRLNMGLRAQAKTGLKKKKKFKSSDLIDGHEDTQAGTSTTPVSLNHKGKGKEHVPAEQPESPEQLEPPEVVQVDLKPSPAHHRHDTLHRYAIHVKNMAGNAHGSPRTDVQVPKA
ncbi:hypothetical protein JVT61DRAFT_15638 [Boletus reticuloceps]|uniref:Uncharacterized protein n=1 Tax=Boletus reticuloceps TaxID=495285 RepID=A0A8I3A215_9AGAM|nr:hypothetical protein JVT61DRAFT_15638 [Boletus reticuloceps]